MTVSDLIALLPLMTVAVTIVVILLVVAFDRSHRLTVTLTLTGLALAFATLPLASTSPVRQVTPLVVVDSYATFYLGLLFAACFVVTVLSYNYLDGYEGNKDEYYLLLLLATLGSSVLVVSNHFASFFLGLEILSVALYTLISYPHHQKHRVEAGLKYLILAGVATAFLLFGIALIYSEMGTMEFSRLAQSNTLSGQPGLIVEVGGGLLTVGIGFKLALVPFHMWAPDVYQGAPAPVTGLIASVSKGGMFALLLRYFTQAPITRYSALWVWFAVLSIASMLVGNLLAVIQTSVKRMLAYSSIAHLGYLLVPFLASGTLAQTAVAFYLTTYFVTILSAFGVVTVLSRHDNEADDLEGYRGLFWRHPWLAVLLSLSLLSLAGIPPTAGLIGKIYLAAAGVESALWLPLGALAVGSVIGVFYYMHVVTMLYTRPVGGKEAVALAAPATATRSLVLGGLALLLVWLGVYPAPLIHLIRAMAASLY